MARILLSLLLSFLFLVGDAFAGVNVNAATQRELEGLPGIGPSKAAAIIEFRDRNGAFSSLADLDKVPGIGPATLDNLRPLVEFGGAGAQGSAAPAAAPPASKRAATGSARININVATAKELEKLPGIGPSKATSILGDRDANGPFPSCASLTRVNGIGKATVSALSESCTVE